MASGDYDGIIYPGQYLSHLQRETIWIDITSKSKRALLVDESGNPYNDANPLSVKAELEVSDIEIGAVEIKDGETDTRQKVKSDGVDNASVVTQNSQPLPTGASTELKQDSVITQLTSIAGEDFATQTTLESLLTELEKKADLTETQPVSIATLPLPTGGSTEAKQDVAITQLSEVNVKLTNDSQTTQLVDSDGTSQDIGSDGVNNASYTQKSKLKTIVDSTTTTDMTYIGKALLTTLKSASSWQIMRIDDSGTVTIINQFAGGSADFVNVWDNRASFTYS